MERRFIPFGAWSPDTLEFDTPELEIAQQVTPQYGSYRPIEQYRQISGVTESEPVTGGIAHLVSEEAPPIRQLPESVGTGWVDSWFADDADMTKAGTGNDYHVERLNSFTPDDTEYIRSDPTTSAYLAYKLSTPRNTPSFPAPALGDCVLKFRLRWRRFGTHDPYLLDYSLWEDGVQLSTTQTVSLSDPDGNEWYEEEWQIPTAVFTAITDWDKLEVRIGNPRYTGGAHTGEQFGTITADADRGNYVGVAHSAAGIPEADGTYTEDVYRFGTYYTGGDSSWSFIQSPNVANDESEFAMFEYTDIPRPEDPTPGADWFTFTAEMSAQKADTNVKVQLLQPVVVGDDDDEDDTLTLIGEDSYRLVHEETFTNIDVNTPPDEDFTEVATYSVDVSVPDDPTLFNYNEPFYVTFTTEYTGTGTGDTYYALAPDEPNGEYGSPTTPGVTVNTDNLNNCIGGVKALASGTAGITWGVQSNVLYAKIGLGSNNSKATAKTDHKISLRVKSNDASARGFITVKLMKDVSTTPVEVARKVFYNIGTSYEWKSWTINESRAKQIADYNDLGIEFSTATTQSGYTFTLELDEFFFEYPGNSSWARIWQVLGTLVQEDWAQVSWIALESLNANEAHTRDRTEVYVGNESSLYIVESFGWTDVGRTSAGQDTSGVAAYASKGIIDAEPKIWDFTSFGDRVIATNFADEIQVKDVTDANFGPLIDHAVSPYMPRARFCATVASSLVLGDINPSAYDTGSSANYTDGKPFHLWASQPMVPGYFDVADLATQSALFALVGQPGAITGLVGGEYGTVFKRNSIWRMMYVGLPQIFQIDSIAIGQGCAYPQSIVLVGQDIFFWGNGGIFALVGGQRLERISGGVIEKAVFDSQYESIAIQPGYGTDSIENESRCYGAYDAYTGTVWWLYRGQTDSEHQMGRFLCYSTKENRFSHGNLSDVSTTGRNESPLLSTLILGKKNVNTADTFLNRGLLLFENQGSYQSAGQFADTSTTYSADLQTKIISTVSLGLPLGREAELQRIRVIYKADPASYKPNFTIVVNASQDPSLQRGLATKSVGSDSEDREGWIALGTPLSGEYFQFSLRIPVMSNAQIKEIIGLQLDIRSAGEY